MPQFKLLNKPTELIRGIVRRTRKIRLLSIKLVVIVWLGFILFWLSLHYRSSTGSPYNPYTPLSLSKSAKLDSKFISIVNELHPSYFQKPSDKIAALNSTVYLNIFPEDVHLYQFLTSFNFQERCQIYFNSVVHHHHVKLKETDGDDDLPIVDPHEGFVYDRKYFKPLDKFIEHELLVLKEESISKVKSQKIEKLIDEKVDELRQEKHVTLLESLAENDRIPNIEEIEINRDEIQVDRDKIKVDESEIDFDEKYHTSFLKEIYRIMWEKIKFDEQAFHDFMTHTKVFNKCFLTHETESNERFIATQVKKLDPLKSVAKVPQLSIPTKKLYKDCRHLEKQIYPWMTQKSPIFEQLSTGKRKTIVPSGTVLISNDCFLNLYYNNLKGKGLAMTISNDHVPSLIRLMRVLNELGNRYPIELIHRGDLSPKSIQYLKDASQESNQDLWLVDVTPAVNEKYSGKFTRFGNKLLATMFNSFAEMMLIDADAVLLKSPESFFQLKKYTKTGALFFKDRTAAEFKSDYDITFYKKLTNSQVDTILFNLPQVSDHSMNREFFSKKQSHYMESGVVLVDRLRHFHQPLIMSLLNSFTVVSLRVYGDKELFWLSLAFSGDEDYEFNNNFAAAIGEITPEEERIDKNHPDRKPRSKEICANHPAHISDEDDRSILWLNSGFRHCGQNYRVDFEKEFKSKKRYWKIKTVEHFKTFFEDKLIIKQAIIPPHKKLISDNNIGEPNTAWRNMREYCAGYTWCGYSSIGEARESEGEVGKIVEYSAEEQKTFNRLGDVWIAPINIEEQEEK